ncbi:MAG: glycosyltransferase family 2 protein [Bacteroidales bacterium]|nr:glycosyltransferase family 2 protein [Bacteroidales bacterium]
MPKLSAVIITFNEERNIGRCLESVSDIADEIVVVDSLSTDNTKQICESFGVQFFQVAWKGYSGQKNYANALASNNWILSIDADEAISEELKESILGWKKLPDPQFSSFNRLTNYCGQWIRHCGWYPDTKLRIFDKTKAVWKGEVHEDLIYDKSIQVSHLTGNLLHYSYYSVEEHIAQTNKFSTIGARQLVESGKKVSFLKVLINPLVKFIRKYVFNLGFLDGYNGYVICRISALQTFLKYFKAWQLQQERPKTHQS